MPCCAAGRWRGLLRSRVRASAGPPRRVFCMLDRADSDTRYPARSRTRPVHDHGSSTYYDYVHLVRDFGFSFCALPRGGFRFARAETSALSEGAADRGARGLTPVARGLTAYPFSCPVLFDLQVPLWNVEWHNHLCGRGTEPHDKQRSGATRQHLASPEASPHRTRD